MKITYSIVSYGCEFDLETDWSADEIDYLAEDSAKDYYENHDGWEVTWPLEISISIGDEVIGKREVCVEFDPTFVAFDV